MQSRFNFAPTPRATADHQNPTKKTASLSADSLVCSRNCHQQLSRRSVSSLAALTNVCLIRFLTLNYPPPRTDNVINSIT
jgi:hypothetical protein